MLTYTISSYQFYNLLILNSQIKDFYDIYELFVV